VQASVGAPARFRQPSWALLAVATAGALGASLGAGALVVHETSVLYPATAHISHFRVADYATLTVVGVLGACACWPVVTRVASAPRRLFFQMAVAGTVLLWLPDLGLLIGGAPAAAVVALMLLHLLIAVVTYNALVHLAPVRPVPATPRTHPEPEPPPGGAPPPTPVVLGEDVVRRVWNAMAVLVAVESALGVAAIVSVPFRRPNTLFPSRGTWLYAAHGAVGVVLGLGAVGVLVLSLLAGRMARIGAVLGAAGVLVGVAGGVFATFQETRLLGMGVMMLGVVMAAVGYLVPALDRMGKAEAARAQAARQAMAKANERRASGTGNGRGVSTVHGHASNGHASNGHAAGGTAGPPGSAGPSGTAGPPGTGGSPV
jgi:hypothetical protein